MCLIMGLVSTQDRSWSQIKKVRSEQRYSVERKRSMNKWLIPGMVDEKLKRLTNPTKKCPQKQDEVPHSHYVKDIIKKFEHVNEEANHTSKAEHFKRKKPFLIPNLHEKQLNDKRLSESSTNRSKSADSGFDSQEHLEYFIQEVTYAYKRERSIKEDVIRTSSPRTSLELSNTFLEESISIKNENIQEESELFHATLIFDVDDDCVKRETVADNLNNETNFLRCKAVDTIMNVASSQEISSEDSLERVRTWVFGVSDCHSEQEESIISDSEIDWRPRLQSDGTSEDSFGTFGNATHNLPRISNSTNNTSSDQSIDEKDEVAMRQTVPWMRKNELYQTYTRQSEELMTSQIVSNYTPKTCEEMFMYFMIRNGDSHSGVMPMPVQELSRVCNIDLITGSRKVLWQNMPEVMNSGCLSEMNQKEIHLHESLFEIITSEASYVHSLTVLEDHYKNKLERFVPKFISHIQFKAMFSKIHPIVMAARKFLNDLLVLWQEDFTLHGLCGVIEKHCEKFQKPYIEFATQTEYINSTFSSLNKNNSYFHKIVSELSKSPEAENLPLDSFLNLPMQRVTKMPLLLKSVIAQCTPDDQNLATYMRTLTVVDDLAQKCNDAVDKIRRYEQMLLLIQELSFPNDKNFCEFGKSERYLQFRSSARICKVTSLKKLKDKVELFLLNDLFVYGKKTSNKVVVEDYCLRSALTLQSIDKNFPSTVMFTLEGNCLQTTSTLVVSFDETSDCQRWLTTLRPQKIEPVVPSENATQVIILRKHVAERHDELNLEIGDIVEIIAEHTDWLHGQKLTDGSIGWFRNSSMRKIDSEAIKKMNSSLRAKIQELNSKKVVVNKNYGESIA